MINISPDAHTPAGNQQLRQTVTTTQHNRHHVPETGRLTARALLGFR
jgi:hypothetical protein